MTIFMNQKEKETIVIGLPVRNEEKSLYFNLKSIREAILVSGESNIKLIVCLNGCTDKSSLIAEKFKEEYPDFQLKIINSSEGLITAQRKIINYVIPKADIYIFSDSDIVIDKESIRLLLETLRADPSIIVAYAKTRALYDKNNKSIFHKMALLRSSQEILSKRFFFHGRFFATRDWFVPTSDEVLKRAMYSRRNSVFLKNYRFGNLLSVDDIFMSSYIMDKYGLNAIRQVESALCYAWAIGSFLDSYRRYRRRNIEMEKMYHWFPEYNYLKPYLNQHTDWKKWTKASLRNKILWIMFNITEVGFAVFLNVELFLANFTFYKLKKQWIKTSTTQKDFNIME